MLGIHEISAMFKNVLFYIDRHIDSSDYQCLQKIQIDIKVIIIKDIIIIVNLFIILSDYFIFYFCFAERKSLNLNKY